MKVSILDDYHDTLRTLGCFKKLSGHAVDVYEAAPVLFDQIVAYAAGKPINVVNPKVLG